VSGVYGSILPAFGEQVVSVLYFDMQPLHGAGWGPRTDLKTVDGILQCTKGRKVKDSNGNLVVTRRMEFWTEDILVTGRFLDFQDDEFNVYRIVGDNAWDRESGFNVYEIARVVGNDGTEVVEPAFSTGQGNFS
jgi:hypothetical protein